MSIEIELPGVIFAGLAATADDVKFYLDSYDIVVNRAMAARGRNEILGVEPRVCRFCARAEPDATFRKEAHAVPELARNGTLISLYECDDCNIRFSAFEDDLGKLTLLERTAGQVSGKGGVPSAKTRQKKSRIDLDAAGLKVTEHDGDPIAEIDLKNKTLTITVAPQLYRPLGAYKALVKIALTLMDERDVGKVPEAVGWLRSPDLTTDQIDDGIRYTCVRSWTPGPGPFAHTRALLLRRKHNGVEGPMFIFVLAFGNLSFQIVVPAPQEDRHLIGKKLSIHKVPVFGLLDKERTRGATRYWVDDLSSPAPRKGSERAVFHFDSVSEVLSPTPQI